MKIDHYQRPYGYGYMLKHLKKVLFKKINSAAAQEQAALNFCVEQPMKWYFIFFLIEQKTTTMV